jgi:small redox-active disulfide protein 2
VEEQIMKLQILGPGCPKCKKLAENAEAAVRELGTEAQVVKVTNIDEIVKFGVMMTPALVIDGKVKSTGRIAKVEEIKKWLCEGRQ